jgi:hypothetical protein
MCKLVFKARHHAYIFKTFYEDFHPEVRGTSAV